MLGFRARPKPPITEFGPSSPYEAPRFTYLFRDPEVHNGVLVVVEQKGPRGSWAVWRGPSNAPLTYVDDGVAELAAPRELLLPFGDTRRKLRLSWREGDEPEAYLDDRRLEPMEFAELVVDGDTAVVRRGVLTPYGGQSPASPQMHPRLPEPNRPPALTWLDGKPVRPFDPLEKAREIRDRPHVKQSVELARGDLREGASHVVSTGVPPYTSFTSAVYDIMGHLQSGSTAKPMAELNGEQRYALTQEVFANLLAELDPTWATLVDDAKAVTNQVFASAVEFRAHREVGGLAD